MNEVMIGKRIREERLRSKLTQETLAEDVDLTTAYIGQVERGERNLTLDNLVKVANRLGVTVDYLLTDSLTSTSDSTLLQLSQLLAKCTSAEKLLVLDIVKSVLNYLDRSDGGSEVK